MASLKQWFGLYQFPTGRRLFAMRQVAKLASTHGLHDIQALAERAVRQAEKAADEELAWRRSRSTKEGRRERAGELDQALDRMLNAIDKQLAITVRAFPTQPPARGLQSSARNAQQQRSFALPSAPRGSSPLTRQWSARKRAKPRASTPQPR